MRSGAWAVVIGLWVSSTVGCYPEVPPLPRRPPPEAGMQPEGGIPPDAEPDGQPVDDRGVDLGPPVERCNGIDDDEDGAVDEGFEGVGEDCTEGVGACLTEGTRRCTDDGRGVTCDARPASPSAELCNGIDDDCSGQIDEGFDGLGMPCEVGEGPCRATGRVTCADDGRSAVCDVVPVDVAELERCNDVDDDCDGAVDEMLTRGCEVPDQPPVCRPGTQVCRDGEWTPCEGLVAPMSRQDICNGIDDDCDRKLEEDVLPGTVNGVGRECACDDLLLTCLLRPIEGCEARYAEQCDPDNPGETGCAPRPEELCDGQDENCDGVIDGNAVCNNDLARGCAVWFGWTTRELPAPSDDWGDCEALGGIGDDISCNWTRGADAFVPLALVEGADVDDDGDRLGMSIRCGDDPAGAYVNAHCRVFLGVGTAEVAPGDGAAAWGACPAMPTGGGEGIACAGSVPGGGFNPMPVPFDLTADTLLAVAFVCEDPADPARAAAMQAAVEVSLAWIDGQFGAEDPDFPAICLPGGDGDPYSACATTLGDGRFRAMRLTADVDAGDRFAVRIRPRRR